MKVEDILLFTDFRPQAVPGPFMVQWRNHLEQCCQGFDTYKDALAFAMTKQTSYRDVTPLWLRHTEHDEMTEASLHDAEIAVLMMGLPAKKREMRLCDLPAEQVSALRDRIEILAAIAATR